MSTERDDDNADPTTEQQAPERPARRPRLMVVAVATAVLLAGGGGAYWAATADSGGGHDAKNASAPLQLGDAPGQDSGSGGGSDSGTGPADGGGTYNLTGTLPKGPDSAAVYRGSGPVDKWDVERLAALLGMTGPAEGTQGAWQVGTQDGTGPALLVSKDAPGTWSYSADGAGSGTRPADPAYPPQPIDPGGPVQKDSAVEGSASSATSSSSASSPAPSGAATQPVTEKKAKAVAAPVLAGLGLSGASVDAHETAGVIRPVSADPVVDGLPTHGWSTELDVAPDGRITGGHGRLAPLDKGDSYPVVGAAQALKELNGHVMHPDHGIASCPLRPGAEPQQTPKPTTTAPGQDKTLPHTLPCVPGNGHPVDVRGAVFGLSLDYVSGAQALVPAWLFEVAQAGVSRTSTVAESAVDPAHVQRTAPPSASPTAPAGPSYPVGLSAYSTSGSMLTLTFYGGVCSTYRAAAVESASQVRVTVTSTENKPGAVCIMIAKQFKETVPLDKPLGGRTVVDASDGHTLTIG